MDRSYLQSPKTCWAEIKLKTISIKPIQSNWFATEKFEGKKKLLSWFITSFAASLSLYQFTILGHCDLYSINLSENDIQLKGWLTTKDERKEIGQKETCWKSSSSLAHRRMRFITTEFLQWGENWIRDWENQDIQTKIFAAWLSWWLTTLACSSDVPIGELRANMCFAGYCCKSSTGLLLSTELLFQNFLQPSERWWKCSCS
jgi:hypothetical protein